MTFAEDDEQESDPITAPFEGVLARLSMPFVASGSIAAGPIAIRFPDGETIALGREPDLLRQTKQLAPLLARTEEATFGQGAETKRDPKVRSARQLRPTTTPFEVLGFDPRRVLAQVRDALGCALPVAELYGLHVYGKGDHFVSHKDTPRGAHMIGTLVVCLPPRFTGGALSIVHDTAKVTVDWASDSREAPTELSFVAFFGDVDHAVAEVKSGHRVTLSYTLHATEDVALPALDGAGQGLMRAFEVALDDEDFFPMGGALCFECAHLYATDGKAMGAIPIGLPEISRLKGRDRTIAIAALAAGLPLRLRPFFLLTDGDQPAGRVRLMRFPSAKDAAALPDELTDEHLEGLLEEDGLESRFVPVREGVRGQRFATRMYAGDSGYFGNEADETDFYVGAALEVVIGPRANRSGKQRRIVHAKFGRGVVLASTPRSGGQALRIQFDDGVERTLLDRFVKDA